jgi:small subunit ribosomal protein S9
MPRKKKTEKKEKKKKQKSNRIFVTGKRKTAVAKASVFPGTGKILINKKLLSSFNRFQQLTLSEPIEIAKPIIGEKLNQIDIRIRVKGSGVESQIDAARLAIARALFAFSQSQELRNAFLHYDRSLLVADTRRKEQCKPNDSKARSRRQKSYR